MEGLRLRAFILGGLLLAVGLGIQAMPKAQLVKRTESYLEQLAPDRVGKFTFTPSPENPEQSYKFDQSNYDVLKPFGIVARIYGFADETYDVILIASNNKQSFHDNRVCFSVQGYTIINQETVTVDSSRGQVPMTLLTMKHPQRGEMNALMFYKGPQDQFFPLPQRLTWGMLMEQLKGGTDLESVFYRIIPMHNNATKEQLLAFVKEYLDAAKESSNGYF